MKYLLLLLIIVSTSCSPRLYINGTLMRKYNTSHNKYTPKNPYVKPKNNIKNFGRY